MNNGHAYTTDEPALAGRKVRFSMSTPSEESREAGAPTPLRGALRIVRENPLGLMLCGLAAGLIAGALAPVTDVERRKLAPVREELIGQAQQAVDDVVERGRQVVEETVAAATESASKHGQELVAQLQQDFKLEPGATGE